MPGPQPTPTRILKLHGSRLVEQRKNEPQLKALTRMPNMPKHLKSYGEQFWRTNGPVLIRMKLLTEADIPAFVLMCEEYEQYKEASDYCKKILIKTQGGNIIQNPAIGVRNKSRLALKASMDRFGLSPAARSKVAMAPEDQAGNPYEQFLMRSRSAG